MKNLRTAALCIGACSAVVGFIAKWEGKSNKAYLDLVQVPTICYGTTKNVKLGQVKSDSECTALLVEEIHRIDAMLDTVVRVPLKPHERAALISFIYNVGDKAFLNSTLLKKLNSGDIKGACNELPKWVYAKGLRLRGLENRRADERRLCLGEIK